MFTTTIHGSGYGPHTARVLLDPAWTSTRYLRTFLTGDSLTAGRVFCAAIELAITVRAAHLAHADGVLANEYELGDTAHELDDLFRMMASADHENAHELWSAALNITTWLVYQTQHTQPRDHNWWAEQASQTAPTILMRRQTIDTLLAFALDESDLSEDGLDLGHTTFGAMTALATAAALDLVDVWDLPLREALDAEMVEMDRVVYWAFYLTQ